MIPTGTSLGGENPDPLPQKKEPINKINARDQFRTFLRDCVCGRMSDGVALMMAVKFSEMPVSMYTVQDLKKVAEVPLQN
jgi:hypothetical protein